VTPSIAFRDIPVPDFADVVSVRLPSGAPVDPEIWARMMFSPASSPGWVGALFTLRERLVGLIGVNRGDAGMFTVADVQDCEALIAVDESHLDFRCGVAVDVAAAVVRVTTTVRLHGWRGRVYFTPVRLVHPAVAKALLNRTARRLAPAGFTVVPADDVGPATVVNH